MVLFFFSVWLFWGDLLSCQSLLLFAAFWSWKRHFTGILQHFGVRTSHFLWYLLHFGARTLHVAGLVFLGVGLGLVFGFISLLE